MKSIAIIIDLLLMIWWIWYINRQSKIETKLRREIDWLEHWFYREDPKPLEEKRVWVRFQTVDENGNCIGCSPRTVDLKKTSYGWRADYVNFNDLQAEALFRNALRISSEPRCAMADKIEAGETKCSRYDHGECRNLWVPPVKHQGVTYEVSHK